MAGSNCLDYFIVYPAHIQNTHPPCRPVHFRGIYKAMGMIFAGFIKQIKTPAIAGFFI